MNEPAGRFLKPYLWRKTMKENTWKIIPAGSITIDFSSCRVPDEVHERIKASLGFPEYYGNNWDALWDCLRDFALSEDEEREIVVRGQERLPKRLKEYCQETISVFEELERKYPAIHIRVEEPHPGSSEGQNTTGERTDER